MSMISQFGGYDLVPNDLLTIKVTTKTKRSLWVMLTEGLFTKNWRPTVKYNVTVETKPDPRIIITDDKIIAHPDIINDIISRT